LKADLAGVAAAQAQSVERDSNQLQIELIWNGHYAEESDTMMNNLVIREVPA
jgi:hypothetical protein